MILEQETLYLTLEETINLMNYYTPKAYAVFEYLNGRINRRNRCHLNVRLFANNDYANFRFPNEITLFLGSIIDHYFDRMSPTMQKNDNVVMSITALTIAHELYHSDQIIDAYTYKQDEGYRTNVEDSAEYSAERYCFRNRDAFKQLFGFDYLIGNGPKDGYHYERASIMDYLRQIFLGTFKNVSAADEFMQMINDNDSLAIIVSEHGNWIDHLIIKADGKLVVKYPDIQKFFNQFNQDFRYMFHVSTGSLASDPSLKLFIVDIQEKDRNPFFFR